MNMVYPNRERIIDQLVQEIFDGEYNFFGSKAYWKEYIEHWESMYQANVIGSKKSPEIVTDEEGLKLSRKVWLSSNGVDHLCHATVYFKVALMRMMGAGGQVVTGAGSIRNIHKELGVKTTDRPAKTFIPDLKNISKKTGKLNASRSRSLK